MGRLRGPTPCPPARTPYALPEKRHAARCVSIRQHASAYVSMRQHTAACVSIRQHTSAYGSIRQHTSAYVYLPERRRHAAMRLALYILYCLFYVSLFLLTLSIVYLPLFSLSLSLSLSLSPFSLSLCASIVYLALFLYQSFYLISPPRINPLPLSFARSPSSFLSHRAVSLSISLSL